jgi:hypothetical protein
MEASNDTPAQTKPLMAGCQQEPCSRSSEEFVPTADNVKSFRDEPLREGDFAVECSNPGNFLKVHPNVFGQMANHPAYSYFRKKP